MYTAIFLLLTISAIFLVLLLFSLTLILKLIDSFIAPVPFISTRNRAIAQVIEALELQPGSVLYDLGCGDGRILIEAVKAEPRISAIGIEKGILPYIFARVRTFLYPITIVYEDMMFADMHSATHIYCYLLPNVVAQLGDKLKRECATGTRVVSCDYPFPDWPTLQVITLPPSHDQLVKVLYIYVV